MSTHTNYTELNQVYLLIPPGEIGYAYVYVANASAGGAGDTYFDDLIIEQKGLDVIQTTDYYPFSYVMKRNGEDYRFGYQGEFAEEDGETGLIISS